MDDNNQSELKPISIDPFGGDYWSIYFFTKEIEGKIQLCNRDGDPLSDILFDKVSFADDESKNIRVEVNGKKSYMDSSGRLLFPLIYDDIDYYPSQSDLAVVGKSGKVGVIKITGECVFEIEWDAIEIYIFSPKFILYKDSKVLLYDENRDFIKQLNVDYIWHYYHFDTFACFVKDGKRGTIDFDGNIIQEASFDTVWGGYKVNSLGRVTRIIINDDKYGLLDEDGTLLLPCIYDRIAFYKEGIARVFLDDKVGYVEADGTINFIDRWNDHYNLYSNNK